MDEVVVGRYANPISCEDRRRIEDYVESVKSVKEKYRTSVIEAIITVKVPFDIRDEVKREVYESYRI